MFLRIYKGSGGERHFRYLAFDGDEIVHQCNYIQEMRIWMDLHGLYIDAKSPSDWIVHRGGIDSGWEESSDIGSIVCVDLKLEERK